MSLHIDDARRDMERLYQEWFARVGPEPGTFFRETLAEDWVYIDYRGVVRGKADYEPYIAHVPPERAPAAPRDLVVRLVGGVAIVHGAYLAPGGGDDPDRVLRFTAVWSRRDDRWVNLAHHATAVEDIEQAR